MRNILTGLFVILIFGLNGQYNTSTSELVIVDQTNTQFYLVIDGVVQNRMPSSNLKIMGVPATYHKIKLMYATSSGMLLSENVNLLPNKRYTAHVNWQNGLKKIQWVNVSNSQHGGLGLHFEVIEYVSPYNQPCFLCTTPTTPGFHYHQDGSKHPNFGGQHGGFPGNQQPPNVNFPHQGNNCYQPISTIQPIIDELEEMNFSDEQLKYAKEALRNKCVTSDQSYKIVEIFTFDDDRMEIAKFCYDRMTDKIYANKLLKLFKFSESRDEMRTYFTQ
ncbi:hypothetical protein CW751_02980 [Brumimicrobium salinarum]|uniref:DUF4476 domain-containing protein n=1 Tax=Brumimicrobium salinarum TaxID=2058658 RepID=A0A2I0R6V3_9FLAO|nr:DUF4476 domain-containing protein [Brumimicrobium salinarum]PKR82312.1 hypothetical protein CW751_02980 [Brumimicrobium salinarum]